MKTVLRQRAFRTLAALYAADALLEWFGSIALMVLVYQHSESTAAAAAMLLCKQIAPGLLLPAVGSSFERAGIRRTLGAAFFIQAAALAALGLAGYGLLVFPLAAVAGTAGALIRATLRTTVAQTLHGQEFRAGNAFLNITMGLAGLIGPALAAVAVATAGAPQGLALTALALALCALVAVVAAPAATVTERPEPEAPAEETPSGAVGHGPAPLPVPLLLMLAAVIVCLFAMDEPALLAYSEHSLGAGVAGYGAIFTAWGIGATAGGLLFTRLLNVPMLRVASAATVLIACAYIGLGLAPTLAVACVLAVVSGVGNGLGWVAIVTAIQEASPVGQEAPVAARLEAIAMAAPGVGILLGGVVAEFTNPRLTLLLPGVLALVVLLAGVLAVRLRAARPGTAPSVLTPSTPGGSA